MSFKKWEQLELFDISLEEMKFLAMKKDMKIMINDFTQLKHELIELKDTLVNILKSISFPDEQIFNDYDCQENREFHEIQETRQLLDTEEGPKEDDTIH